VTLRCRLFLLPVVFAFFAALASAQEPAYLDTHLSPQERAHNWLAA